VAIRLRLGFSPETSRVRILPCRAAALAVFGRSASGRITIPGVSGDHQRRRGGARHRDAGGVERGDVGGGAHHCLLDLPFADHRPAAAGDGRVRGLERAPRGFHRSQPARAWEGRQAGSDKAASAGHRSGAPGRWRQAHRVTCTVPNSVASSL
jgi:hypothetical protein